MNSSNNNFEFGFGFDAFAHMRDAMQTPRKVEFCKITPNEIDVFRAMEREPERPIIIVLAGGGIREQMQQMSQTMRAMAISWDMPTLKTAVHEFNKKAEAEHRAERLSLGNGFVAYNGPDYGAWPMQNQFSISPADLEKLACIMRPRPIGLDLKFTEEPIIPEALPPKWQLAKGAKAFSSKVRNRGNEQKIKRAKARKRRK